MRVVSEDGDVLQGVGFESDAKLDNWKILSNVTGIFQDAAKRMKDEDKKQAEAQRLNNPPSSSSQATSSQSAKPSRPASPKSVAPPASQSSAAPRPANPVSRPHGLFAKPNAGNP